MLECCSFFSARGAECEVAAGRDKKKMEKRRKKTNAASPHNPARSSSSSANKLQRQPLRQRDRQHTAVGGGSGGKTNYTSTTDETFI